MEGQTKPGGGPCNNPRKGQHTAEQRERKADMDFHAADPFLLFIHHEE